MGQSVSRKNDLESVPGPMGHGMGEKPQVGIGRPVAGSDVSPEASTHHSHPPPPSPGEVPKGMTGRARAWVGRTMHWGRKPSEAASDLSATRTGQLPPSVKSVNDSHTHRPVAGGVKSAPLHTGESSAVKEPMVGKALSNTAVPSQTSATTVASPKSLQKAFIPNAGPSGVIGGPPSQAAKKNMTDLQAHQHEHQLQAEQQQRERVEVERAKSMLPSLPIAHESPSSQQYPHARKGEHDRPSPFTGAEAALSHDTDNVNAGKATRVPTTTTTPKSPMRRASDASTTTPGSPASVISSPRAGISSLGWWATGRTLFERPPDVSPMNAQPDELHAEGHTRIPMTRAPVPPGFTLRTPPTELPSVPWSVAESSEGSTSASRKRPVSPRAAAGSLGSPHQRHKSDERIILPAGSPSTESSTVSTLAVSSPRMAAASAIASGHLPASAWLPPAMNPMLSQPDELHRERGLPPHHWHSPAPVASPSSGSGGMPRLSTSSTDMLSPGSVAARPPAPHAPRGAASTEHRAHWPGEQSAAGGEAGGWPTFPIVPR